MRESLRPDMSPKQSGFMTDKGTTNAISFSRLMERFKKSKKISTSVSLIILRPLTNKEHVEVFRMPEKIDIDGKDLRVIRNLYRDQTASVRIEGEHSDFKPIKRDVRQRCVMSPDFFTLYSEIIVGNLDYISGGNLRYADDTVLIAESGEQQHQKLLDTAVLKSERMGLSLNVMKTE
ncbi:retrovirus-related pol polyprotein from type-1 retrotransposable element r2 [Plakobranchus ocellatus]|uniref:Retrovirus-related pol polyprotein from type-1 retrotransposable element r2 n=1 Tax=Plakobranchus ocellatus TaxID=259542 RepID=A0AAV4ATG9_9GAST|nr:retrovirus-related pol polyprotein from type-1 retrotransposable element r2 [Plakobranchus ocellatus]